MVDHYYHKGCGDNYKPSSDTTAVWASKVPGHYWYSTNGILTDQPSQYGHLLNLGQSTEVFQLWCCAPSGPLYYRSGNANGGWNGTTWKCLDGKASITTTYVNGTSGYRIWSDGFIEQWGRTAALTDATATVTSSVAFRDTNYLLIGMAINAGWRVNAYSSSHTVTTAVIGAGAINGSGTGNISWYAAGY